jgi:hypothetical protein
MLLEAKILEVGIGGFNTHWGFVFVCITRCPFDGCGELRSNGYLVGLYVFLFHKSLRGASDTGFCAYSVLLGSGCGTALNGVFLILFSGFALLERVG